MVTEFNPQHIAPRVSTDLPIGYHTQKTKRDAPPSNQLQAALTPIFLPRPPLRAKRKDLPPTTTPHENQESMTRNEIETRRISP